PPKNLAGQLRPSIPTQRDRRALFFGRRAATWAANDGPRQAARLATQRRQCRVSTSRTLVSAPWHFSQRLSRIVAWCDRQALVAGFSEWRGQPSDTHLPKVMGAAFARGTACLHALCRVYCS